MTYLKTSLAAALIALALLAADASAQCSPAGCPPSRPMAYAYAVMPAPVEMLLVPASEMPPTAKSWRRLSNLPGWEGYGAVTAAGWLDSERFRKIDDPGKILPVGGFSPEWLASGGAAVQAAVHGSPSVVATVAACATGDPTGFCGLLNAARAARGLPPVAYDPAAANASAVNDQYQIARGLGHWFTAGFAQCSAVGVGDAASALGMWAASGPHAAILFAPSLRTCGYSQMGGCATASGSMGY
jgi:hypothetical protein